MVKVVWTLRSLYRSGSSVAVNKQLLSHPPRQHYSTGAAAAARKTLSFPPAKNLSSDCYYGSPFSGCLGSRRLLHGENTNQYIRTIFDKIQVDLHDRLEQYAFRMYDSLRQEGLADEANQIFRPLLQKKRANVPAVAVFTYMIDALLKSGETNMALNVYRYMLATGVTPSTFTYNMLIQGLSVAARSDSILDTNLVGVAKECFLEMLDKGRKPNYVVFRRVFAHIAWLETVEEVRGFLELIKAKGFVLDDDCFDFEKENPEDMIKAMKLLVYLVMTADDDMRIVLHDWHKHGTQKQADNMRNALLDDGNRDEAWMLFEKQYSESSMHHMVVLYTCVIETFINAGKTKGALEVYQRMLDDGYAPCSYTYSILIKALAADPSFFGDAKKYFLEMMEKGIRPNAATYTAVLEGFARQEDNAAVEEGRKFVKVMMGKGFVPYTEDVMKVLRGKPEPAVTRVMDIISSKWNY